MRYDGIALNNRGKALVCPICENENTDIDGDYCQICGTQISNKCTDCSTELTGYDRYCTLCGASSTFYRDKLLEGWQNIKNGPNSAKPFLENIKTEDTFEPDFEPNYYLIKD